MRRKQKMPAYTKRFCASGGVYARRNICANLQVCLPPEFLYPRLRQVAASCVSKQRECGRQ